MNNEFNLPPPHENGYPFLMDDKVLEQIGFAVGCFENYLVLDDDYKDMDRRHRRFLLNRFVIACVIWCQNRNSAYDNTGNGYGFVTDMLKSCCGRQMEIEQLEEGI